MPRRYKKRPYRKKNYKRNFTKTRGSGLTKSYPLSKKFTFKTRYVDLDQTLNSGVAGIPVSHVYNLTNLFDPDSTGVGHQPIGFDQIMPMYDHYTVIGARARVTFHNTDTDDAQVVLLQVKDSIALSTNMSETIENGMTRYTTLSSAGSAKDTQTLTMNFSSKKFFGRNPMASDKNQGTISSGPAEGAFLHVTVAPLADVNSDIIRYTILIEFIAILTEPRQLAQS